MKTCILSRKGGFTVEAAIIVPFILLSLVSLIYLTLIAYQKALLVKISAMAAQQAAEIWVDGRKDIFTGGFAAGRERDSLYEPLLEILGSSPSFTQTIDLTEGLDGYIRDASSNPGKKPVEHKLAECRKALYSGLAAGILKPKSTMLSINVSNKLIGSSIDVTITQQVKIPLGGLKKLFTGSSTLELEGRSTAVIARPAEYIRNIDVVSEYAWKLGSSFDLTSKLQEFARTLEGK